jgi:hypothetical protein
VSRALQGLPDMFHDDLLIILGSAFWAESRPLLKEIGRDRRQTPLTHLSAAAN